MKQVLILPFFLLTAGFATHCVQVDEKASKTFAFFNDSSYHETPVINPEQNSISTRFEVPEGFVRVPVTAHSFADYLRNLPLKTEGSKVKYYNGQEKDDAAYVAVVNTDIGNRNLQQCADAVMRLRGEYFYQRKEYDSISFLLTNGFPMDYSKWMAGNRIRVTGNQTVWIKTNAASNTYQDFRNYMDVVFSYAGTLSLSRTLHNKTLQDISIGDVFIVGGSPGHAVIVVDAAQNKNGHKIFILAQSYMPAQETQVLRNPDDDEISPWYRSDYDGDLITPEWVFKREHLKGW